MIDQIHLVALYATIRRQWGDVEKWVAACGDAPAMPEGEEFKMLCDALRLLESKLEDIPEEDWKEALVAYRHGWDQGRMGLGKS